MSEFIVLDFNAICRFCLEHQVILSNIFDDKTDTVFIEQILFVIGIKVTEDDNLPTKVCHRCRYKIELLYEFKNLASNSNQTLSENLTIAIENCTNKINPDNEDTCDISPTEISQNKINLEATNLKSSLPTILENNILEYPNIPVAEINNQCLLCLKKYSDEACLQKHILQHIDGTNLTPYHLINNNNLFCKPCNRYFRHRFSYLVHQREHLDIKPYLCRHNNCDTAFYSNAALKQHLMIHSDRKFVCQKCATGFKRKSDLKSHEATHEDNTQGITCEECSVLCKNRITFAAHMRKHKTDPSYQCTKCYKQYYSRSELHRHLHSHSNEKMFKCLTCNRSYYSQSAVNRHFKMCSK